MSNEDIEKLYMSEDDLEKFTNIYYKLNIGEQLNSEELLFINMHKDQIEELNNMFEMIFGDMQKIFIIGDENDEN